MKNQNSLLKKPNLMFNFNNYRNGYLAICGKDNVHAKMYYDDSSNFIERALVVVDNPYEYDFNESGIFSSEKSAERLLFRINR